MENASKALLIAASILIAIVLIAFAMKTIGSTAGTQDSVETTMNATEVATFNNKFFSYVGTNKSKAEIVSLINMVIANNATSSHKISINGVCKYDATESKDQIPTLLTKLTEGNDYHIKVSQKSDIDSNGYIINIQIRKKVGGKLEPIHQL